jgi:hypothetical protein
MDKDTPDPEHVNKRRVRREIDPKIEAIGGRVIPAFPGEG